MTLLSAAPEPLRLVAPKTPWTNAANVSQEIQDTQRTLMMRLHMLTLALGGFGIVLAALGLAPGSNARVNGQLLNAIFAIGLSVPAFLLAAAGRVKLSVYLMMFSAAASVVNVTLNIGFGLRAPAFVVLALSCLTLTCFFGLKVGRWASGLSVFYIAVVYFLQHYEFLVPPTASNQPLPTATVISHLLLFLGTALLCQTFRDQGDIATNELKRQNAALEDAKEKRLSLLSERQKFLGNMAHNIRTPISIIQSALTLMEHPRNQGKDVSRYTSTLKVETKKLGKLLAQYSDVIAIKDGLLTFSVTAFNPAQLLDGVCQTYSSPCAAKGISLTWVAESALPDVWHADTRRVEQMAVALLENALKYSDSGEIRAVLKVENQTDGGRHLLFSVTDHGLGVSEQAQTDLFKPFTQVASNSANTLEGLGLSLYITRCLVQAMGGQVGMSSSESQGTCFWFSFPDALQTPDIQGAI